MKKAYLYNGTILKNVPPKVVDDLVTSYSYENPAYLSALKFSPWGYTSIPETINLIEGTEEMLRVPRGITFDKLKTRHQEALRSLPVIDKRITAPVTFPKRLLKPNAQQTAMLKAVESALKAKTRPNGNFLLVSSTSTGKTIAQALVAERLSQRTLVLCKTNLIRRAWEKDLTALYGITAKSVGVIQQSAYRIGQIFTLSSLATLHRRQDRWEEIFANFGTIILDEVHTGAAQSIFNFVDACPCKYVVGATATIRRNDRKEFMVKAVFGEPVIKLKNVQTETEHSMPIDDAVDIPTNFFMPSGHEDFDFQKMTEEISGNDERNDLVVEHVFDDWMKSKKNVILVTSNRVAHVQLLAALIRERGIKNVSVLTGAENSKHKQVDALIEKIFAREVRVIVATDAVISTGANINPINRLHIAMPIKDKTKLEQLLGRIRRKHPGKINTRVRYYRDTRTAYCNSVFKNTAVPVFQRMEIKRWRNTYLA